MADTVDIPTYDASYTDQSAYPTVDYSSGSPVVGDPTQGLYGNGFVTGSGDVYDSSGNLVSLGASPTANTSVSSPSWWNSPAAAAGINALIQGGLGLYGAHAAGQASQTQANAYQQGLKQQLGIYQQNQANLYPYMQAGYGALQTLQGLLGTGSPAMNGHILSVLKSLPGYQFTLNQGLQSVQNSAAARGLGSSGAALRGAADYATGLANSTWQSYVNPLMTLAQTGENAAAQQGITGAQTGQAVGSTLGSLGQAQAMGTLGAYNALASAGGNIGQSLLAMQALQRPQITNYLTGA